MPISIHTCMALITYLNRIHKAEYISIFTVVQVRYKRMSLSIINTYWINSRTNRYSINFHSIMSKYYISLIIYI